MRRDIQKCNLTRRDFLGTTTVAAGLSMSLFILGSNSTDAEAAVPKPNSKFGGVQIGAITYSWRSMPCSAENVLQYCIDCGISSIELMGNVAESYAGIPTMPAKPKKDAPEDEQKAYNEARTAAVEARRKWRISLSMKKYEELRRMYNDAGVGIHIVKFSPAIWTGEEIDYAFNAAKTLGAVGVSNEIGEEACRRLGPIAGKHGMKAIFHQHFQPGQEGWTFEHFLDIHPAVMLNFDAGHYLGATGKQPVGIIERLHDRIVSVHLKDKTRPNSNPPNTNMPWGLGLTRIDHILNLIQKEGWPIFCDIELEYPIPEGSDAVKEVRKCVEFCKIILEN